MEKSKYIEDLREIREMMNRSSRFISLSGLSGVSAGIFALLGAFAAYQTVYANTVYMGYRKYEISDEHTITLLLIALCTLALAVSSGIWFTSRESRKKGLKLWDSQSKRFLINLALPLITGGLVCLMLLLKGFVGLIAPLTLIFYGLALVNVGKYSLDEIRSLGLIEIILGLTSMHFIGFGLLFWAFGFGVLHIIYGIIMHLKYKS